MFSTVPESTYLLQARKDTRIIIYGYTPAKVLVIVALILFALSFLLHTYQVCRYRTKYFIPIPVGLLFEVIGYTGRAFSAFRNPYTLEFFIIQYFFIVVAPVFFSAAIYATLSTIILRLGTEYSLLTPKLILWIFITCDVTATVIQVAGAALIGIAYSKQNDPTTPNNILLAGLAFQVFTFFMFVILFSIVLFRSRKIILASRRLTTFCGVLAVATLLVYLRTCFRLAETAEGLMEGLSTHEVYFGTLEFMPIVIALGLLNFCHPGKYLKAKTEAS